MSVFSSGKSLVITVKNVTRERAKDILVHEAKEGVKETIRIGEGSPNYTRYVNGHKDAPEETVVLPGPIVYHFNWLEDAAKYALAFLRSRWNVRGPGREGHFVDSYFLMGDGREISLSDASKFDEIRVINDKPYARKAQIGFKGFYLSRGLYDDCQRALMKEFGSNTLRARVQFMTLEGGYVLKRPKRNRQDRRTAGEQMRYPCVVITRK